MQSDREREMDLERRLQAEEGRSRSNNRGSQSDEKGVAVYVDNVNLSPGHGSADRLDYDALLDWIEDNLGNVARAVIYVLFDPTPMPDGRSKDHVFMMNVQKFGYEVKAMEVIRRRDGSEKKDWDVGIAVDVLNDMHRRKDITVVVLCTGDGDFAPLVQDLKAKGKEVVVVGYDGFTSQRLRTISDRFVPIAGDLVFRRQATTV
jgi:uncharacterized LabA/DUF88 family protein